MMGLEITLILSTSLIRRVGFLVVAAWFIRSSIVGGEFAYPRSSVRMPVWLGRVVSATLAAFAIFLACLK